MSVKCYFDLDGTLYNLYNIPNWLDYLENEKPNIFSIGSFMSYIDTKKFYTTVSRLVEKGVDFGVITWLPMQASAEYNEVCRAEKMAWIRENLPFVSEINIIPYGIPKQNVIQKRATTTILIDDNSEVCNTWNTKKSRISFNVSEKFNVVQALEKIEQRLK